MRLCAWKEKPICASCSTLKDFLALMTGLSLNKIASNPQPFRPTLRMIELLTIPREHGDVVVLLLVHPGLNLLGRYLPPSKVNDLLLADISRPRHAPSHRDAFMMDIDISDIEQEMEAFDVVDLATFLESVSFILIYSAHINDFW